MFALLKWCVGFWLLAAATIALAQRNPESEAAGARLHPFLVAELGGVYHDPELQSYIERIGRHVVAHSAQPGANWQFFILDTSYVNAHALPGGYIYLTRGVLAVIQDEAELAAMLAHEAVHITEDHYAADRVYADELGLGDLIGEIFNDPSILGDIEGAYRDEVLAYMARKRAIESATDIAAVHILADAGYSPYAMARSLVGLRDWQVLLDRRHRPDELDEYDSHPADNARILAAVAEADLATDSGGAWTDNFADYAGYEPYNTAINGLPYGDTTPNLQLFNDELLVRNVGLQLRMHKDFAPRIGAETARLFGPNGAVIVVDTRPDQGGSTVHYLREDWLADLQAGQPDAAFEASDPQYHNYDLGEGNRINVYRREASGRERVLILMAYRQNGHILRIRGEFRRDDVAGRQAYRDILVQVMDAEMQAQADGPYVTMLAAELGDGVDTMQNRAYELGTGRPLFYTLNRVPEGTSLRRGQLFRAVRFFD